MSIVYDDQPTTIAYHGESFLAPLGILSEVGMDIEPEKSEPPAAAEQVAEPRPVRVGTVRKARSPSKATRTRQSRKPKSINQ